MGGQRGGASRAAVGREKGGQHGGRAVVTRVKGGQRGGCAVVARD